jgi:hypothetical protein
MTNPIRPVLAASLPARGEAQTSVRRKSSRLRGSVGKRCWGGTGVWEQNGRKAEYMNQGELPGKEPEFMQHAAEELERAAVTAFVVAKKRRNGCGAKGRREVEG